MNEIFLDIPTLNEETANVSIHSSRQINAYMINAAINVIHNEFREGLHVDINTPSIPHQYSINTPSTLNVRNMNTSMRQISKLAENAILLPKSPKHVAPRASNTRHKHIGDGENEAYRIPLKHRDYPASVIILNRKEKKNKWYKSEKLTAHPTRNINIPIKRTPKSSSDDDIEMLEANILLTRAELSKYVKKLNKIKKQCDNLNTPLNPVASQPKKTLNTTIKTTPKLITKVDDNLTHNNKNKGKVFAVKESVFK